LAPQDIKATSVPTSLSLQRVWCPAVNIAPF
jgi:hypothetical protein